MFKTRCAVCPMKISFIRLCEYRFECDIKRYVKRKEHDYTKDLKMAKDLLCKFVFEHSGNIFSYDSGDRIDDMSDEEKEFMKKVMFK
jgi:hypothetical protein